MAEAVPRPASSADLAAIVACTRAAYAAFAERIGYDPPPMTTDYVSRIESDQVWVHKDGGSLVGVLVLVPAADHPLVYSVAVSPDRQGEGHGGTMMAFAEDRARGEGLPEVWLYTNALMPENVVFYESRGYAVFDRRPHPTRAGSTLVYMRKVLGGG